MTSMAWLWLADALRICILVPLWLIAISLHHLSEAVCWLGSMLPDFDARRQRVIRRANAIVPVDEVRRRLDALTEAKP